MSINYKYLLKEITTFIFDVDGVLTDGSVMLLESGDQIRKMNIKDGYALQLAVKKDYRIAIITGGSSKAVQKRFNNLGIRDVFLKADNKLEMFEKYLNTHNIKPESVLYMGDDIPDYHILKKVALPCCPADAVEEIKAASLYVSDKKGGEGCVRDIIEQTMRQQGKWFDPVKSDITEKEFLW